MRPARVNTSTIGADYDRWLREATSAAIEQVKELLNSSGLINSITPVSRLKDAEIAWIVSTAIWAWIRTKSEQAATEGLDPERGIHTTHFDPCPWDLGSVRAILPELAKACPGFSWSKPLRDWSRDELAEFLLKGFNLIRRAHAARDAIERRAAGGPTNPDVVGRQINRAGGNPAMTVDEATNLPPFV